MTNEEAKGLLDRLENVLRCMRNQNSGADIHEVGNIRNIATGLKGLLEDDPSCMDHRLSKAMAKNVEDMVVHFFKYKYGVQPLEKCSKHKN